MQCVTEPRRSGRAFLARASEPALADARGSVDAVHYRTATLRKRFLAPASEPEVPSGSAAELTLQSRF